jgi:hypothetical protein
MLKWLSVKPFAVAGQACNSVCKAFAVLLSRKGTVSGGKIIAAGKIMLMECFFIN